MPSKARKALRIMLAAVGDRMFSTPFDTCEPFLTQSAGPVFATLHRLELLQKRVEVLSVALELHRVRAHQAAQPLQHGQLLIQVAGRPLRRPGRLVVRDALVAAVGQVVPQQVVGGHRDGQPQVLLLPVGVVHPVQRRSVTVDGKRIGLGQAQVRHVLRRPHTRVIGAVHTLVIAAGQVLAREQDARVVERVRTLEVNDVVVGRVHPGVRIGTHRKRVPVPPGHHGVDRVRHGRHVDAEGGAQHVQALPDNLDVREHVLQRGAVRREAVRQDTPPLAVDVEVHKLEPRVQRVDLRRVAPPKNVFLPEAQNDLVVVAHLVAQQRHALEVVERRIEDDLVRVLPARREGRNHAVGHGHDRVLGADRLGGLHGVRGRTHVDDDGVLQIADAHVDVRHLGVQVHCVLYAVADGVEQPVPPVDHKLVAVVHALEGARAHRGLLGVVLLDVLVVQHPVLLGQVIHGVVELLVDGGQAAHGNARLPQVAVVPDARLQNDKDHAPLVVRDGARRERVLLENLRDGLDVNIPERLAVALLVKQIRLGVARLLHVYVARDAKRRVLQQLLHHVVGVPLLRVPGAVEDEGLVHRHRAPRRRAAVPVRLLDVHAAVDVAGKHVPRGRGDVTIALH
ncbi:Crp/Fnr family transcriptional regulator [Babesia caballi]|uniref:Crp/Fnr family transcriptional regulator n=1 Tax=Babesia caballi TaxID=5871 RepID=A0AAV4LT48_BABCB|nr:Crp/Fnr family transcriptional regulator [Babesia caballi]